MQDQLGRVKLAVGGVQIALSALRSEANELVKLTDSIQADVIRLSSDHGAEDHGVDAGASNGRSTQKLADEPFKVPESVNPMSGSGAASALKTIREAGKTLNGEAEKAAAS